MKWIVFFVLIPLNTSAQFTCGDSLIDIRDGSNYRTVLIGNKCWMRQNLNFGNITPSFTIANTHSDMHNDSIPEKYAPDGDSMNVYDYGALYEWDELMEYNNLPGGRGLCPQGWHVPTYNEWLDMFQNAGVDVANGSGGNKLKEAGQGFGLGAGTNTSGFSARAAGDRAAFGTFYGIGLRFIFWTSTETAPDLARHFTLWAENDTIESLITQKITGLACRCVMDSGASTKVNELNDDYLISMYPNPAVDYVKIISSKKIESVSVVDLLGRNVIVTDEERIETSGLVRGVYLVKIEMISGHIAIRKLILN